MTKKFNSGIMYSMDTEQELLKDPEVREFVRSAIKLKQGEMRSIEKTLITNRDVDVLLENPTEDNLNTIIDASIAADEYKSLKNQCARMQAALNKANGVKITGWQKLVNHAVNDITLEQVVEHFLGECRHMMRCPFHEDKTASMHISINEGDNGLFYCHGCAAKGNQINFTEQFLKCDFKEAVKYLSLL